MTKQTNSKPRIFVQMVSYRDPECHPTLRNLFEKASHPERITVGLCWQYHPEEDAECFADEYPCADQVKVLQFHCDEAQGAGWARVQAQSLWHDEPYILQIQSHMRFAEGWDETLIKMLEELPSEKAILTGWVPTYTPPDRKMNLDGVFPITGVNAIGLEGDAQMIHLVKRMLPQKSVPSRPMLTATWVGNFMFCRAEVQKEVPFDPYIYFWGEELNYSARLWTHGYDMYHVNEVVLWHYWNRQHEAKDAPRYRDHGQDRNRLSLMRNRHLLGMGAATNPRALKQIEKYNLGTQRTLADYFKFYGVDLATRSIAPHAAQGLWHAPDEIRKNFQKDNAQIFVAVASFRDPELTPTLEDMFAKASAPHLIRVGVCLQRGPDDMDCTLESSRADQIGLIELDYTKSKGANWARAQAMELNKGEPYVLIIDSHMRFEPGWDNVLVNMLQRCPSDRPVISGYTGNYNPPDNITRHPQHNVRIRIRKLGQPEDPQLVHVSGTFTELDDERAGLYPTPFVVGNFIFGLRDMFEAIPIDPHFPFYGDEISYAARLWTHGWDVFQPDQLVLYHYWIRTDHLPIEHYRNIKTPQARLSWQRGEHLLGLTHCNEPGALLELAQYGLGDARTLDGFWQFAGINWKERSITTKAQEGWWNMTARDKAKKPKKKAAKKGSKAKPAVRKKAAPDLPRIFVQIASYRDPDCQHTVKELFEHAAHPERIFVGICWQFVKDEDQDCFTVPYPRPDQVRVMEVDAKDSRGACWARSQTQSLWEGEEYTLQIDSHMRFEKGWDDRLFEMWGECNNKNAILTCYPPGFTPPRKINDDRIYGMSAKEFNEGGILLMTGSPSHKLDKLPEKPIKGAFASGCMFFGPARIIEDVPYDPYLYFFGEEISLAVRFWTHGYDLFHPNKPVIYHDWDRKKRTTHFDDHKDWGKMNEKAYARVRHMLGTQTSDSPEVLKELATYGLGKARSLQAYQEYSGIDFRAKTITESAKKGEFGVAKKSKSSKVVPARISGKKPRIFVQIASYRDRECQWTVKDLFEKATHPERLSVGICWQYDEQADADCFQITTRPEQVQILPYSWREGEGVCWARNQTQGLWDGEEYTLQIDSHMRFVPGWDEKLIAELEACESDKPLLSCSPASYTPPNHLQQDPRPTIRRVLPFFEDGNLRGRGEYIDKVPEKPLNGAFVAAGFMFSRAEVIEEVPYDPYLYFDQEEISYAARLYTHGWDIFSSRRPLLYHYYNVPGTSVRPLHWGDLHAANDQRIQFFRKRGIERFNHLTGFKHSNDRETLKDIVQYGFGTQRSLADYEAYSGVDFKRKVASDRALRCGFIQNLYKYRSAPIHIPEIDGEDPKNAPPIKGSKPSKKTSESAPPEKEIAFTTLDPTIRAHKTFEREGPKIEVGDYVPMFHLTDDENRFRAIEVMAGRMVLLVFLPSNDDAYSRRFLEALSKQFEANETLMIWQVFVANTAQDKAGALRKKLGLQEPLWNDEQAGVADALGIVKNGKVQPAAFLLSRNLKLMGRHENLAPEQLAAALVNQTVHAQKLQQKNTPKSPQIITQTAPVLIVPDVLPPEFCDYCIDQFHKGHTFEGTVGAEKKTQLRMDAKVRTDHVVGGKLLDEIDERLSRSLFPEISKVFGFDVTYRELYKIGLYSGGNKGFFKPHRDNFDTPMAYRRVAMTLHLSDNYEGGGLRFPEYGDQIYRPQKGAAIAFSAANMHEALPVTSGERFIIVGFFHGDEDEAYRRQYRQAKKQELKVENYTPVFAKKPDISTSRDYFERWKKDKIHYELPGGSQKKKNAPVDKPVMINTKSGHQPKKIYESEQAIILDNFLPDDVFEKLHRTCLQSDYEFLNMGQKVSRAWHLHDGHPMRGKNGVFYYAKNHPKPPKGDYVYPSKRHLDAFMDGLLSVHPHVEHLIGKESKDWWHVSANEWIYPPTTGLSIHDDGSGVYSGAYTYFLNPTWRPHWGGMLVMMDEETNRLAYELRNSNDQQEFYKLKYFHANNLDEAMLERGMGQAILPKGNRIVFIANDAYHMVTRVNEAAGDNLRLSIAGFYNRKKNDDK